MVGENPHLYMLSSDGYIHTIHTYIHVYTCIWGGRGEKMLFSGEQRPLFFCPSFSEYTGKPTQAFCLL